MRRHEGQSADHPSKRTGPLWETVGDLHPYDRCLTQEKGWKYRP